MVVWETIIKKGVTKKELNKEGKLLINHVFNAVCFDEKIVCLPRTPCRIKINIENLMDEVET
jgi:hypothetical protein